eukprot:102439_1
MYTSPGAIQGTTNACQITAYAKTSALAIKSKLGVTYEEKDVYGQMLANGIPIEAIPFALLEKIAMILKANVDTVPSLIYLLCEEYHHGPITQNMAASINSTSLNVFGGLIYNDKTIPYLPKPLREPCNCNETEALLEEYNVLEDGETGGHCIGIDGVQVFDGEPAYIVNDSMPPGRYFLDCHVINTLYRVRILNVLPNRGNNATRYAPVHFKEDPRDVILAPTIVCIRILL